MAKGSTGVNTGIIINAKNPGKIPCDCTRCYHSRLLRGTLYCSYYDELSPKRKMCARYYCSKPPLKPKTAKPKKETKENKSNKAIKSKSTKKKQSSDLEITNASIEGVYDYIKEHQTDVIIFGYGGSDYTTNDGYFCYGLVYKMNIKIIKGSAEGSANRCILQGAKQALEHITKPSNVILLTSTSLGFKKASKGKGPNQDLCNEIIKLAEDKQCSLSVVQTQNTISEVRLLLKSPEEYFRVLN